MVLRKILLPIIFAFLAYGFWSSAEFKTVAAGVAIFLFGMLSLEEGFKTFTGGTLENFLRASTDRLWKSLTFGVVTTSIMQSSSLVSIITISFLSAGLLGLTSAIGIIFGAMPGLTSTLGVALLTALTYGMGPATAMVCLLAIYVGGTYSGSYASILINIPGTAAAAATNIPILRVFMVHTPELGPLPGISVGACAPCAHPTTGPA